VLNFCLLGSGSSGNAIVVASDDTQILIDCGLSYRELARRADMAEISLESLSAVLLTHEHGDHAGGIGTLCRKHGLPVYMTAPTLRALPSKVGVLPCTNLFQAGAAWEIGELRIESFSVTHDAADPVGYAISARGAKVVRQSLSGSHALVLETNYCPELLSVSDYPESVKQRIRSRFGHLSNDVAAQLLKELLHPNLSTVVLVHISENNNTPLRAQQAVQQALGGHGAAVHLASQDRPTPRFRIAV
jgi:phosphoribosyl 1,2-cyclic phosphodiesterase